MTSRKRLCRADLNTLARCGNFYVGYYSGQHTSCIHASSHRADGVAELAASREEAKYSCLLDSLLFQAIGVETLCPLDPSALDFVSKLGRWLSVATRDVRETAFLFQRLSVAIQRSVTTQFSSTRSFGDLDLEPEL